MSEAERRELYAWVSRVNDVYNNPGNLASDSGREMDFNSGICAEAERFDVLCPITPEEFAEEMGWNRSEENDLLRN